MKNISDPRPRIRRGDGERKSYALDIAAQYHLTAEEIVREKNPLP